MRATPVGDIRTCAGEPGCVEFNAAQRRVFWTCPCGCGSVGWVDMMKCCADRKGPTIRYMEFDVNEKPYAGEPMEIGILYTDGTVHWAGTLVNGEWKEKKYVDDRHSDGLCDDQRSDGPPS